MPDIHPTAIVSPAAEIGPDVQIGPYAIVDGPVRLGRGVRIIAHAHLTGHTEIGEETVIHPFAAIGGPPQDHAHKGERSYCRIGARVTIREGVTIHCGTMPESETVVGDDCMLMAYSHVGHNCRLAERVTMTNASLLGGYVQVGPRVTIGGGALVHQFVRVGEYAMIGGGSKLTQDAAPFMTYVERNRCMGINRIGLKRAGFTAQEIDELRDLHRKLFRESAFIHKTAAELTPRTAAGRRLIQFLTAESKRGIGVRHEHPGS